VVVAGAYTEESGYQATKKILDDPRNADLTAFIYANDLMAMGGMRRIKECGKEIPEDISIVGFDDITSSQFVYPALTTVAQPSHDMGRSAAQLLLSKAGLSEPPATTNFATELKIRDSVSAPRSSAPGSGRRKMNSIAEPRRSIR